MCARLIEQHDFRSAFYELRAARKIFNAGFKIFFKPETQTLGEDFDFTASRANLEINIEATALKEKEFNEKTALNALNWKRRQLADDKPAVIFCLLPASWDDGTRDMNEFSQDLANRFLRGTERVNAVVFQIERQIDFDHKKQTGASLTITKTFFNDKLRHSADLSFLIESDIPESEQSEFFDKLRRTPNELSGRFRGSEFYRWVHYASAVKRK